MGLADAREAWRTARAAVEAGRDPATEKAAAKRRQPDTVRAVGEQFIEKWHRPRNRTAGEVARQLAIHVYPEIGDRDIQTITRRDILDVLDAVEKRGAAVAVNRVLANTRRLFAWATERGIIDASPVTAVKPPAPETARDRVLTDVEVRAFWLACDDVGEPFGAMFRLLLLTGQRLDEVASAPWAEFDLPAATWRLPGARTKNGRANVVPLAPAALDIIAGLPRTSRLLFPARFARVKDGTERPASGFSRAKARLDAAMVARLGDGATLPPWRITTCAGPARPGWRRSASRRTSSSMRSIMSAARGPALPVSTIGTTTTARRGRRRRPGRAMFLGWWRGGRQPTSCRWHDERRGGRRLPAPRAQMLAALESNVAPGCFMSPSDATRKTADEQRLEDNLRSGRILFRAARQNGRYGLAALEAGDKHMATIFMREGHGCLQDALLKHAGAAGIADLATSAKPRGRKAGSGSPRDRRLAAAVAAQEARGLKGAAAFTAALLADRELSEECRDLGPKALAVAARRGGWESGNKKSKTDF